MIGGRLAAAAFEPDLVMTDGEALLVANAMPVGVDDPEKVVEAWNPYRTMFDVVWSGRRHVMMGASQIDPFGNQNFAFIGECGQPKAQLLGMRGAPGNTISHTTSYWIPNHSPKVFVRARSTWCRGVGYDRAAELGDVGAGAPRAPPRRHQPRGARLRDARPPHAPASASTPASTVDDVVAATGFELAHRRRRAGAAAADRRGARGDRAGSTPTGCATRRCRADAPPPPHPLCDLVGIDVPDRADRHGLGRGRRPRRRATAEAGGLGHPRQRHDGLRPAAARDRRGEDAHRPTRSA